MWILQQFLFQKIYSVVHLWIAASGLRLKYRDVSGACQHLWWNFLWKKSHPICLAGFWMRLRCRLFAHLANEKSSRSQVFHKKGLLKNFANSCEICEVFQNIFLSQSTSGSCFCNESLFVSRWEWKWRKYWSSPPDLFCQMFTGVKESKKLIKKVNS